MSNNNKKSYIHWIIFEICAFEALIYDRRVVPICAFRGPIYVTILGPSTLKLMEDFVEDAFLRPMIQGEK